MEAEIQTNLKSQMKSEKLKVEIEKQQSKDVKQISSSQSPEPRAAANTSLNLK